jgi:hypothetical protein
MIKKFESFKLIEPLSKSDVESNFRKAYNYLKILHNDSYPTPELFTHKYLNNKFFDIDFLIKELDQVEDITYHDKANFVECYYQIYNYYRLDQFPDFEYIDTYFLSLSDITDVSFTILLNDKKIEYEVNMLPSIEHYLKDDIEFNIDEFDMTTQELIPLVKMLKEKYKVQTSINKFGNVKVLISL